METAEARGTGGDHVQQLLEHRIPATRFRYPV
jgi:hypothetical protein